MPLAALYTQPSCISLTQMMSSDSSVAKNTLDESLAGISQRRALLQKSVQQLATPSVRGYINSISISTDNNLQVNFRSSILILLIQFGPVAENIKLYFLHFRIFSV